jgi:hypothetical protein
MTFVLIRLMFSVCLFTGPYGPLGSGPDPAGGGAGGREILCPVRGSWPSRMFLFFKPWGLSNQFRIEFAFIFWYQLIKMYGKNGEIKSRHVDEICTVIYKCLQPFRGYAMSCRFCLLVENTPQDLSNMPFLELGDFLQYWGPMGPS